MADEHEDEDKLKLYWEHFFRAETGTYEKSTWLDLFLAEFLIRLNEGADPKELITFCPVSGVVSLVGCEMLCGVHRVTSALHVGAAPPAGAPASPAGAPASPALPGDAPSSPGGTPDAAPAPGGAFSRLAAAPEEVLRRYLLAGPVWKCLVLLQALGVEGLSCCRQLSAVLQWACGELPLDGEPVTAAAAAAAAVPPSAPPPLHTLLTERVWSRHAIRERRGGREGREGRRRRASRGSASGSSSSRSSSRSPDRELPALRRLVAPPPARAARFQLEATPRRRDLMQAALAPAHFLALATDLLRALCRAESGLVGAEGSQISVQCVEFALRRLRALAGDARPAAALARSDFARLLLVALDETLARGAPLAPDPLPSLLELLDAARALPPPPDCGLMHLAFGAAYGAAAVLHRLLVHSRSAERLLEFEERFRSYAERRGGTPFGECLELVLACGEAAGARDEALELAGALAEALGRLVSGVKRARARVEHAAECARAQHRACRAPAASPHHAAGARAPCAAGLLARALGAGLASCAEPSLARVLLRVLLRCGACCCAGPAAVVEGAVRLAVAGHAPPDLCLRLVERAAFGEAGGGGGGGGVRRRTCAQCRGGAGAVLVQYSALLQPEHDGALLRAVTAHLARVAPRCPPEARRELLLGVLYPAFIVAKHRYAARREDKARELTAACLELFATLLDSVATAELFVARGGLGYALELAELPEFAERCCAILQAAVAAELARGAGAAGEPGPAAAALLQALATAGEAARALYRTRLPDDEARALGDLNAARVALGRAPEPADEPRPAAPATAAGDGDWSAHLLEATCVRHVSDAAGVARRAAGAWRAGAALSASSPAWRRLLARAPQLAAAHALLRLALRAARDEPPGGHALELAESLLTVHAALGGETEGRSAAAGCAAAREAAAGTGGAASAGGAVQRALLEALLRVCTLRAARTERMPPRHQVSPLPPRASSDAESEPTRDGYEADVETRPAAGASPGAGAGADAGAGAAGELAHPDLCLVALEATAQLASKAASEGAGGAAAAVARALLARLGGVLARHAPAPAAPRLLLALLRAAQPLLETDAPELHELQCGVLELVETLAGAGGVEPRELARLLRVLRAPAPPARAVLRVLARLAARAADDPLAPTHFLPFPAPSETSGAALRVELAGWAPWLQGFALVAWLRASPPADDADIDEEGGRAGAGPEPAASWHVCSVGGAALQLQAWLEGGGALSLRLARGAAQLAAARVARALRPRRWQCLALQVREAVRRRRLHVQVTVYVDGCECDTVSLPLQGVLVRRATDAALLAGHAAAEDGGGGDGGYALAGLSLYRAAVLDAEGALRRAALGPHAPPARHTLVDRLAPNYAALISPDLLERNLDWERVYEASSAKADELDDALLLAYTAQAPDVAAVFEEAAAPAAEPGGRVVPVAWLVPAPQAVPTRALAHAMAALGGADALLLLAARAAELRCVADAQAAALAAALQLARAEPRLHAALYCDEALDMLQAVVGGECGQPSVHTVAALLAAACGAESPLSLAGGRAVLRARSSALALEPRALLALAAAWRELRAPAHWVVSGAAGARAASGELWALALSAIRALLHSTHPHRAFNLQQVSRAGLLPALLAACRERALGAEGARAAADAEAGAALVALCRALLLDPPQPAALALITDFLVLMHQASDTFVTHSRPNFYFLVCADVHEEEERALLPFLRRRTDSDSTPAPIPAPPPPDDVKELKGFINMQIKEGRKESMSSTTSGVSDTEITDKSTSHMETPKPLLVVTKTPSSLTEHTLNVESSLSDTGNSEKGSTDGEDSQDSEKIASEGGKGASVLGKADGGAFGATDDHLEDGDEGVEVQLRVGLLGALAAAAAAGGGPALAAALPLPALAALANARAPALRAAAVRLVHALHARCPAPPLTLVHLAHQVSLYPASRELAQACAALLTKCDVSLQDQLDEDIWADAGADACSRAAPLLAVLRACVHDAGLARDVVRVLACLARHAPARALHDAHAPEALLRALRAAAACQPALLPDLRDLLVLTTLRALDLQHGMQRVSEVGALLRHEERAGGAGGAAARETHCALLRRLLLQPAPPPQAPRYFTVLPAASEAGGARRAVLLRAHALLLTHAPLDAPRAEQEAELFDACFRALLAEVCSSTGGWARGWRGAGGAGAAPLLLELLQQALLGGVRAAAAALRALYHAGDAAQRALTPADPADQRKLGAYLLSALQRVHAHGAGGAAVLELAITDWAREWAQRARPAAAAAALHEAARARHVDAQRWARAARAGVAAAHRQKALQRLETLAERVTESAMQLTRQVVEQQNRSRKAFMEQLRRAQLRASAAAARWARVLDALTHEHAVWHFPDCWPASWALDEAEGPGRVRVRLRRAQLRVPARLLQEGHKHKAAARAPPLQRVLAHARRGLAARLRAHEAVAYMARVLHVTAARETAGELLLSERAVHFMPEAEAEAEPDDGSAARSWPLEGLVEVASRRWCLQERAVELFLSSGHAHLLAFAEPAERDAFLKALHKLRPLPGGSESERLAEALAAWRSGQLSNWDYLMRLNGLAGRSYNDLMQYPVLPFVLADYSARLLDLLEPGTFRDLSRPVAVQNPAREKHYVATYTALQAARGGGGPARAPHHYASLYSNSGAVLHYLVRVSPFTELFLNYQDNNFDMPDRTFHSLATTWRLITRDSPTDVKELVPELFYLPELFSNREGLALGVRQCGAPVDAVELPPWALGDARLFTLAHRQALEAPAVTEGLPAWIDLIFGYKQTGQAAIDALNVFPACTYYGFDPAAMGDEVERTAAAAMVRTYGQAPRQLLRAPHPRRALDVLAPPARAAPPAACGLRGARWGRYCGSPAAPPPRVTLRRAGCGGGGGGGGGGGAGWGRVEPLERARAAALLPAGAALLPLAGGAPALLTWGHADRVLRLRRRRDAPPDLVLHVPADDRVVAVATCALEAGAAFVGLRSGRVAVVRGGGALGAGGLRARSLRLHAHAGGLVALAACARAALLVSAGADGRVTLWELHRLQYLRTLPAAPGSSLRVRALAISPTLGDVCAAESAEDAGAGAVLRVHTCNGVPVACAPVPEPVTSLCYSTAPEGVSVNCVAAGLASGDVRLYSAWDLQPLAHLPSAAGAGAGPLVSLCYSRDADVLFGCYADGSAAAWESEPARAPPRLLPALALL